MRKLASENARLRKRIGQAEAIIDLRKTLSSSSAPGKLPREPDDRRSVFAMVARVQRGTQVCRPICFNMKILTRRRRIALVVASLVLLPFLTVTIGARRLAAEPPIRSLPPVTATFHMDGEPVRVLAIQAGTVSIKGCHYDGCLPEGFPYPLRFASVLADPRLGARMPIWTYVVLHKEGVFVVDAGATPAYNDEVSWAHDPIDGRAVRSFLRLDVTDSETLPVQLQAQGIDPSQVKAIVLTHQHVDHTASVPSFPQADIWTARAEDEAERLIGGLHWRWRNASTHVRYVDVEGRAGEGLPYVSVPLTKDGRVEAFHTPGHTPGSLSLRLRVDEGELWFIGDASFRAVDLTPNAPTTAMHTDTHAVRAFQSWLVTRPMPRRFLAAHDKAVPAILSGLAQD